MYPFFCRRSGIGQRKGVFIKIGEEDGRAEVDGVDQNLLEAG